MTRVWLFGEAEWETTEDFKKNSDRLFDVSENCGYMIQQGKLVLPRPNMFVGFGGVADVKFRGTVVPGDKLIILCKCLELRPRRAVFQTQGIVNNKLVFEAKIIGMPV